MQKKDFNDLWVIINNMDKDQIALLPQKFLDFVQSSMDPGYVSDIDPDIDVEEQNVSAETRSLLATLLLSYWAEDPNERRAFAEKMHANELKHQGKPEAIMTEDEYQELLEPFDEWNDFFGPIPFWAVSRHWYPYACFRITDDPEEAEITAGSTGLKQVEVTREERKRILEEARQWVLVQDFHTEEIYYRYEDLNKTYDSTREIDDYYQNYVVIKNKHFYGALITAESVPIYGIDIDHTYEWVGIICIDGTKDGQTEEHYHETYPEWVMDLDSVYSLKKKAE